MIRFFRFKCFAFERKKVEVGAVGKNTYGLRNEFGVFDFGASGIIAHILLPLTLMSFEF